MSSTRTAPRTTSNSKTTSLNTQTNGASNSYDMNDPTSNLHYSTGNNSEFDLNLQRSSLKKNVSQYEGIYRNARFIHAISSGLLGQQVIIHTSDHERFHGVLETFSPDGDIVLTVSHRLDKNNNDLMAALTVPFDLFDTIDSSAQTFELHKRIIKISNIVEIIAVDLDLSANAKCSLDENPKVSQLEDDRFSRMQHFYDSDEIDPETLEDLEPGDDGKSGFDPEDMFHTNREKFNTTTDFDESKYTNVPIRQLSTTELAQIEKKAQEIEKGTRADEIDEDDAGVKRPSQSNILDDRNSNIKANRSNQNNFLYDNDYNPSKRDNWRDQRGSGNINSNHNNRRGSGGNFSKQNQYPPSNNRQQYNNRTTRNNRYIDNRSPNQGRNSPLQATNEESAPSQRMNSGSFSQDQNSDPASPSATVTTQTIYPSTNRSLNNQNSPTTYPGSSSSRTNSISVTSPSANQQSGTNKLAKTSLLNEQQSAHDETDQPKQQRISNNQTNTTTINRPSHLQSKQQASSINDNTHTVTPIVQSNQDDTSSSHDLIYINQSSTTRTTTPNSTRSNGALNPEADEFVPVFSRESNSRPESRDASTTSSTSINAYISHAHPQTIHLLQQAQQQAQSQTTPHMIPLNHPQNAAALYQQYYQTAFTNMPQFINAASQQMTVGVMGTPMIPTQPMIATGPNTNNSSNGSSSGMTTPNSSVSAGPTYKTNNSNNQATSGDNNASGVSNVPPKKAIVSVQRAEQPNISQHPVPGAQSMVLPAPPIRYYSPDYFAQQTNPSSMQLQQIPLYYQMNPSGLIQATGTVGQPQNMMLPSASTATGSNTSAMPTMHYAGVYADPRMYGFYSSAAGINPASVHPHWQLARSPPQLPSQPLPSANDQQRSNGSGQNVTSHQSSSTSVTNTTGRPGSGSGQINTNNNNNNAHPITSQYAFNGALPTAFAYGTPSGWIPTSQPIQTLSTNMSPQINAAYNIMYDSSQPLTAQQAAYLHRTYDASGYYAQPIQSQVSQPLPPTLSQQQQQQQQQQ